MPAFKGKPMVISNKYQFKPHENHRFTFTFSYFEKLFSIENPNVEALHSQTGILRLLIKL